MAEVIKSYKGFNKDMTCRGFQYEEGKEYEEETADACHSGFHACEYPLDCLGYYSPNESVYHEVEQNGEFDRGEDDSKVASTKIKIGARLDISGLVKAAIDFTMSRVKKEAESDEDCGASSATGDYGASSATGYKGASSATGDYGASSATGNCGASSATGYKGASSANDSESVAVAWGYKGKAMGVIGSHIVLAEWKYIGSKEDDRYDRAEQEAWEFVGAKMFRVDGEKVKPDTWYRLENGELMEVENED
jgi:hypothetical protein|nr:MAG TPA: hypothetical protein [Caudoviricetes sp.]